MNARIAGANGSSSRTVRVALNVVAVAVVSTVVVYLVWFAGLDAMWSIATVIAFGSVGVVFSNMKFEDTAAWDAPARETPRGIRLALPMMETSLAACDRLARPAIARSIHALVIDERDDRSARAAMVRQLRVLLVAELRVRGVDPARDSSEAVTALLGPDALTVLQPNDDNPVSTAAIANCLDAVERLTPETHS